MIKANHPNIEDNEKTYLTSLVASGETTLTVLDNSGFNANDIIIIGDLGAEQTEIGVISSISGKNTITLTSSLSFSHDENARIRYIGYDKVKFYKASSSEGAYTLIATKDIAVDEPCTNYDDSGASSTDYFKLAYYNSITTTQSDYSDSINKGGLSESSLAKLIEAFLSEAQDKTGKFYKREDITRWINDCKDDAFNKLSENNENFFSGYHELAIKSGENEVALPSVFGKLKMAQVSYDGSTYNLAHFEDLADTNPSKSYSTSEPKYYLKGTAYIGLRPTPTQDVTIGIKLWSEDYPPDLDSDADELPSPLNRYRDMVINYLWYRALRKDKKFTESRIYKSEYEDRRFEFVGENNNLVLNENRKVTVDNPWGQFAM